MMDGSVGRLMERDLSIDIISQGSLRYPERFQGIETE